MPPGTWTSVLGIALYLLLNWSYTTAVFTSPGTTTSYSSDGYESLPTQAPPKMTSFTVKSTGTPRFCKKCNAPKPDRAHHCSTCQKCVLKMDHHCPWLATCVGFRNYKPFLLFLTYTSLFCWLSTAVTSYWCWKEIFEQSQYMDTLMPINYIMLAIMAGVIGLALAAFTAWHYSLALAGQTHIECLEGSTRYLSPTRTMRQGVGAFAVGRLPQYGAQLGTIMNNAPAPGQEDAAPASSFMGAEGERRMDNNGYVHNVPYLTPQRQTWEEMERQRERDRYDDYLDEEDSKKMPHAFDLGWKKNLAVLFGPCKLLWLFPICNSVGDGWSWEPSPKWLAARDQITRERQEQIMRERNAGWGRSSAEIGGQEEVVVQRMYLNTPQAQHRQQFNDGAADSRSASRASDGSRSPNTAKADRILGRETGSYADADFGQQDVNLRRLSPSGQYHEDDFETSSDETGNEQRRPSLIHQLSSGFGGVRTFGGQGRLGQGQVRKEGVERKGSEVDDSVD